MHCLILSRASEEVLLVVCHCNRIDWVPVLIQCGDKHTLWTDVPCRSWSQRFILTQVFICDLELLDRFSLYEVKVRQYRWLGGLRG